MPPSFSKPAAFARLGAILAAVLGVLALTGWALDIPILAAGATGLQPMIPSTAAGMILAALALWLQLPEPSTTWRRRIAQLLGCLLALHAAIALCGHLIDFNLSFDRTITARSANGLPVPPHGYPAVLTAVVFAGFGLALVFLDRPPARAPWTVEVATLIPIMICLLALVGYICHVPSFYGWLSRYPNAAISLPAAAGGAIFGMAILCARPSRGLIKVLASSTAGGVVARRLLLAPILIPLLTGLVQIGLQRIGFYNAEFAFWFFAFLNIFIFTAVIWWIATLLYHADTIRREAELKVRELNASLEKRSAELEAINRELQAFAYSISHDLRAPVRAVSGFANFLKEDFGPQLPDEGRHLIETIRASANQMGRMIDALLELSRLGRRELTREPVDMDGLVTEVLSDLKRQPEAAHARIEVGRLRPCVGDPILLRQVWLNLLSNALKFTSRRENATVQIGDLKDDNGAVYFVRDNGEGFDSDQAYRLFAPFRRLHGNEFDGEGIGLSIVKRIVERHGGRVWAEAETDRGATFFFTINLPEPEVEISNQPS